MSGKVKRAHFQLPDFMDNYQTHLMKSIEWYGINYIDTKIISW